MKHAAIFLTVFLLTATVVFGQRPRDYRSVPQSLVGYTETKSFSCNVKKPVCFAASSDGTFYVGCGEPAEIRVFSAAGEAAGKFPLESEPYCLTVGMGQLLAGFAESAAAYTFDGKKGTVWNYPGKRGGVRSLAVCGENLFAADSVGKAVYRFDKTGKLSGQFAELPEGSTVFRSPIAIAVSPKAGLLYVTNPGKHRVEVFTPDGHWESPLGFGTPSGRIDGFCGCCNPADLAVLPDGRIVTSEKSILRVKIFTPKGKLDTVVASPRMLETGTAKARTVQQNNNEPVQLAVLGNGNIAVFDPVFCIIRIFSRTGNSTARH